MDRRLLILALGALGMIPGIAAAQIPLSGEQANPADAKPELGGTPTVDLIVLRRISMGVPLRNGGVVRGSESVTLDGVRLVAGTDYQIEHASGVLYLTREVKLGQTLMVSYRFDKSKESQGSRTSPVGTLNLSLLPKGGLGMVLGFGQTERLGQGQVLRSNIFGWRSNFNQSGFQLNGLLLMAEREQVDAESIFEFQQRQAVGDTGRSRFLMQGFRGQAMGGTVEASIQDIDQNFANFGAVREAGLEGAQVDAMAKEKGLKRMAVNVRDLNMGGLKVSHGYQTVQDGKNSLDWRSAGLSLGGWSMGWSSRRVENGFTRFRDIREGDRDQLQREAGMRRDQYTLGFNEKGTKFGASVNSIFDPKQSALTRRELNLEIPAVKLNAGDQRIDRGFSRMGSLTDAERNQYHREIGMSRNWMNLELKPLAAGMQPFSFSQTRLASEQGQFDARDIKLGGRGWTLEQIRREVSSGFANLHAMHDGERDGHIRRITEMYQPGGFGHRGEDVGFFFRSQGLTREVTRLTVPSVASMALTMDHMTVTGEKDRASVTTVQATGKQGAFAVRHQKTGKDFNEIGSMMLFERDRLSGIQGLSKTDASASLKVATGNVALSTMKADTPTGGASRQSVSYKDGKVDLAFNRRNVEDSFGLIGQLVDPERDLLASLRGFRQQDLRLGFKGIKNLTIDLAVFQAENEKLGQDRDMQNLAMQWQADKLTQIGIVRNTHRFADEDNLLFDSMFERFSLARSLGRYGALSFLKESQEFEGTQANRPGFERTVVAYEGKVDARTTFRTEQSRTAFDDGDKEDISTHTVSTQVDRRSGISVSQVDVNRKGDDRDEQRRQLGFWFDFGNGLRITYGMNRHVAVTENGSTKNQQVQVTGGQVGAVKVENGGYTENQWDGQRTQATTTFAVSTAKPLRVGILSDLQFRAGLDSAADRFLWQRENKTFSLSGKVGNNSFAYSYLGQISQNGFRGIDRQFTFSTDQDPKRQLRASLTYKVRTLPWDEDVAIRNFQVTARPWKNIEVSHQLMTNPEVARGDAILGSVTQNAAVNRWKLDVTQTKDLTFGAQWEEVMDDRRPRLRTGGLNMTLFNSTGSPLSLFYGIEQADTPQSQRLSTHRYHLRFDQRPGPNKMLSLFFGNISYRDQVGSSLKRENWTARLDLQIRL